MSSDNLQTFLFDNTDIRGGIVTLDKSFAELLAGQPYSVNQQQLMAEFAAANILITSHLKFEGMLSLQARGQGPVSLLMTECNEQFDYRATLQADEDLKGLIFSQLFTEATLAITVEPKQGQRYQGIVPLTGASLAACLEDYFQQSEQLPTWFRFSEHNGKVRGIMLQALPAQVCTDEEQRKEDWIRIKHLASTLTTVEMSDLDNDELLHRLYHEETVRLFEPKSVRYFCSCSAERMERALLSLGESQLREIIEEDGIVKTQCHFCQSEYHFNEEEIKQLLNGSTVTGASH